MRYPLLVLAAFLLWQPPQPLQAETTEYRPWIVEMKQASRGPFKRIRWFCNDGTVHPPKPYVCSERGGGIQHGQWTDRVVQMRQDGYRVATVLAAVDTDTFLQQPDPAYELSQILLERFLITADDGWIFRGARTYRGALQVEDEEAGAYRLLTQLLSDPDWLQHRYLLLREAVRWLPHGVQQQSLTPMRQLARTLAEEDPNFEAFRAKLHILPERSDLPAIIAYVETAPAELADQYALLLEQLRQIYQQPSLIPPLQRALKRTPPGSLNDALQAMLVAQQSGERQQQLRQGAELLAQLRQQLPSVQKAAHRLQLTDLSLLLEAAWFQWSAEYLQHSDRLTRRELLGYLRWQVQAVYGSGLIHHRQRQAALQALEQLQNPLSWTRYKAELDYLARIADWSGRTLGFFFSTAIKQWQGIEPLVIQYPTDRLRGSLLAQGMAVIERLQMDADQAMGVRHRIFDRLQAGGVRALNPGLARGVLQIPRDASESLASDAVVVLPETREDLPPVAGILTEGEGNALSHIQLLARNLGLPNVRINPAVRAALEPHVGETVVLAVSPGGRVRLEQDAPQWDRVFAQKAQQPQTLIEPDLDKLNLSELRLLTLDQLRAEDSGRVVGPKAANLGELKFLYPDAVPQGLALPFGQFRRLLDQPFGQGGQTAYDWLNLQYRMLDAITEPAARQQATAQLLQRMRNWIAQVPFPPGFRQQLRQALQQAFGADGSYGVFVRSDTNVEDLPGFTGAGLNKTVPHVVGVEAIEAAIRTVWASPFAERAFRWRQGHMRQPQHVYCSVLLQLSVDADKSGVLVTADVNTGRRDRLTVAVNEGVGGAVAGQRAEELLIGSDGQVRQLAQAAEPQRRRLRPQGGVTRVPAVGPEALLTAQEVESLLRFAADVPTTFPLPQIDGQPAVADVEFGFQQGRFVLFQIRPFVESRWARQSQVLQAMDRVTIDRAAETVRLDQLPEVPQ